MDDLLREFLTETNESIAQLDVELVRLEQNPEDPELISSIFRLVHTVKGTCGFLGLPRLEHVAHAGENVLGKFRDKELSVTPHAVTLILKSIDTIKTLLAILEETEKEAPGNDDELIAALNALSEGREVALSGVPSVSAQAESEPPPSSRRSPQKHRRQKQWKRKSQTNSGLRPFPPTRQADRKSLPWLLLLPRRLPARRKPRKT
jgi:two-component system chemotaxis sensor kinase CheA